MFNETSENTVSLLFNDFHGPEILFMKFHNFPGSVRTSQHVSNYYFSPGRPLLPIFEFRLIYTYSYAILNIAKLFSSYPVRYNTIFYEIQIVLTIFTGQQ